MIRLILVLVIVVVNALLNAHAQGVTNWSHRIISKERHPLSYWLNPCGEAINELTIDGKRFEHVRGVKTFYLQVPNTNLIVFVVDETNYSVGYHIFNMNTDEDIAISARDSVFGQSIGATNVRDTVELEGDGIIALCHVDQNAKSTLPSLANLDSVKSIYYLNAGKKAIVAEKTLFLEKGGKLIRQDDKSPPF